MPGRHLDGRFRHTVATDDLQRWPRRPWSLSSLASGANRVFPLFVAVNEAGSSREQVSLLSRGLRVSEGTAAATPPGDVMHIT